LVAKDEVELGEPAEDFSVSRLGESVEDEAALWSMQMDCHEQKKTVFVKHMDLPGHSLDPFSLFSKRRRLML
jgi:hypothetical protein